MQPERPESDPTPSELLARHLAGLSSEEGDRELERLCIEHPEAAEPMRALHRDWKRMRPVLECLGLATDSGSVTRLDGPVGEEDRAMWRQLEKRGLARARYRLGEELGRGGQGSVHRALDQDLDRELALKFTHATVDPESVRADGAHRSLQRFVEEAKLTAKLDHPGIVPVHDFGLAPDGRFYYTMKLVQGRDFARVLARHRSNEERWSRVRLLEVLVKAGQALAFAHAKGVIHRDLKPSNLIVAPYGEVYVMDWGLARVLESAACRSSTPDLPTGELATDREAFKDGYLTLEGEVLGTPAYMSPEQASGDRERIGPATDVYAFGAILYEILSGAPPYLAPGEALPAVEVLRRVKAGPPRPLRELAPDCPEELLDLCERAMERDPALRQRSMADLVAELQAWLEGRTEPKHASIFEVLRLSTSLVVLHVGVLVAWVAAGIVLSLNWEITPQPARVVLTGTPLLALAWLGWRLWSRKSFRLGLPLLVGAAALVGALTFVLLHTVPAWAGVHGEDGTFLEASLLQFDPLVAFEAGPEAELQRLVDRKLLFACLMMVVSGSLLRRLTRAPASTWLLSVASLACVSAAFLILGWRELGDATRAAAFLPVGLLAMGLGLQLERGGRTSDARPLLVSGFVVFVFAWFALAQEGQPVLLFWSPPHEEEVQLSMAIGGLFCLLFGGIAQRMGTPLLLKLSPVPYLLAPAGVLLSLSELVQDEIVAYEVLLPLACLGFVLLSVLVQRRNLLYAGGGYLAVALVQVTGNHFREEWSWTVALLCGAGLLIAAGVLARALAERRIVAERR